MSAQVALDAAQTSGQKVILFPVSYTHLDVYKRQQFVPGIVRAVVPGRHQKVLYSGRLCHLQLQRDGIHQSRLAHGPDDAAGTQNGDAALNAQPGIEGLSGQRLSLIHI